MCLLGVMTFDLLFDLHLSAVLGLHLLCGRDLYCFSAVIFCYYYHYNSTISQTGSNGVRKSANLYIKYGRHGLICSQWPIFILSSRIFF